MSRCFPFPPPGYEREHRPNELDLLKEAKSREKKHKREKKDKERKKNKEKKEKDGSDEKHKDKKDRKDKKDKKEKHKDKKKDKEDHGKDKDKSSISEESSVAGKLEDKSGGKLQPNVHGKDRSGFVNEGKSSTLFHGQNGGKPSQSFLPSQSNDESKFVQELDRRIKDDQRGSGSQLPERVAVVNNKNQEMVSVAIRNSSGLLVEEKAVDNKNKKIDRKFNPQGLKNDFSGSKMVQNLVPITKAKDEGIPKPVDEQNGRRWEDREKYMETCVIKHGDKQKDRVKESQAKEKDRDKEKKKDENAKIKHENKNSSQNHFKDDRSNEPGGFCGRSKDLLKEANSNAANEGNIRKRKDEYTNGFLHESEIRPNKMLRPAPHQMIENGRKLDPFQTPTKSHHDKHAVPNSVRVDNREGLANGFIEAHKPSPPKPASAATVVSNQIADASKVPRHDAHSLNKVLKVPKIDNLMAEASRNHGSHPVNKALKVPEIEYLMAKASRRPPHPDSKFLAEVLAVPKMEDWSDLVDQDWLFSKEGPADKHKAELVGNKEEDQHVWSEALHLESADVCALPYVIPY